MRILHTSDWHLGATFESIERESEHARFFAWLVDVIETEAIDVLVVAGDVFDHAHPSADSQRLYYELLRRLGGTRLRTSVFVAGNHDSASRLDAPRDVLSALSIVVVGALTTDEAGLERALVPVVGPSGEVELVVLAVPYLHEYRLGVRMVGRDNAQILADFRELFASLYTRLVDLAVARHPGVPIVATGHMACTGSLPDDAPVEIHLVGSLGGLPVEVFDARLAYVALGHVHRAYPVATSPLVYYSGSPIAFSRKETKTTRAVRIVDVRADAPVATRALAVPTFRRVIELEGEVHEVEAAIVALAWTEDLAPIVCATIHVSSYDADVERRVRAAALGHPQGAVLLADFRTVRIDTIATADASADAPLVSLAELHPEQVFEALCASEGEPVDADLLGAFREALSQSREVDA